MTFDAQSDVRSSHHRNVSIVDLVVFVAATAFGIGLLRAYMSEALPVLRFERPIRPYRLLDIGSAISTCLLVPYTLAVLLLQLLPPKPPLRCALRRPGTAACLAVALVAGLEAASLLAYARLHFSEIRQLTLGSWLTPICMGVASSWLTLALCDCWNAEPTWTDRAGRLLGVVWLVALLVQRIGLARIRQGERVPTDKGLVGHVEQPGGR